MINDCSYVASSNPTDLMVDSLEQCAKEAMEDAEMYNPMVIIVTIVKAVFPPLYIRA